MLRILLLYVYPVEKKYIEQKTIFIDDLLNIMDRHIENYLSSTFVTETLY